MSMNKEEYLTVLKDQIRDKHAKGFVSDEIRTHIEEQASAYMNDGMDREEAYSKALTSCQSLCVGIDLFSRPVARQVSSALVSLTSVFGMGTGGPSPLKTPTAFGQTKYYTIQFPLSSGILSGRTFPSSRMVHLQGLEPWTP